MKFLHLTNSLHTSINVCTSISPRDIARFSELTSLLGEEIAQLSQELGQAVQHSGVVQVAGATGHLDSLKGWTSSLAPSPKSGS